MGLSISSGLINATAAQQITGANSLAFVTPIRADLGIVVSITGTGVPQGIIYYGS